MFAVLVEVTDLRSRLIAMRLDTVAFYFAAVCLKIQSDFTDVLEGSELERDTFEKRV